MTTDCTPEPREVAQAGGAPASLIGKAAWSSVANLCLTGASALTLVLVARLLGVAGAGEVAYSLWVAGLVAQVSVLALPQTATQFLASAESAGVARWVARRAFVLMIPGAAAASVVALVSRSRGELVLATALLTVAQMLSSVGQAFLAGRQQFRRLMQLSATSAILQVVGVAVAAEFGGATEAVFAYAFAQLPLAIGCMDRSPPAEVSAVVLERMRRFAFQMWLAILASLLTWSRLEFLFLQARDVKDVALYATALAVAQLGIQPTTLLATALVPHFGSLLAGGHAEAARQTFSASTRVFAALAFPLCFGLAALSPALVPLLFGHNFAGAVHAAALVTASASVVALSPPATAFVFAHERARFVLVASVATGVVAVAAFAVAVPRFGVMGAAGARGLVQGAAVGLGFGYVAHRLATPLPWRRIGASAASALVAGAAGSAVVHSAGETWLSLAAGLCVVVVVYALVAPRLRVLEPSDTARLVSVLERFPPSIRGPATVFVRSLSGEHRPPG
jgi:O-antigen/teichoic acid export membrane protein